MLVLPDDAQHDYPLLEALVEDDDLGQIVLTLARAMVPLSARLAAGKLPGDPAALVGENDSGDAQKALDVGAHDHVMAALKGANIRHVLSEEAALPSCLDPEGDWDLVIDPIDGSGSIGIGAPLGMLFAIYPAGSGDFLRAGREAVAAGYASFGHSLDFGYSLGDGVHIATYDAQSNAFHVTLAKVMLPDQAKVIAYNASNERHWPAGLQAYVNDLRLGKTGPRGRDFNMRWLAAAVGELHRIILKGGAFLYPQDARKGYENGRLRLTYEAVPIAFLMEQAGGRASNGARDILDLVPKEVHEFVPLIFGASEEVALIEDYLAKNN
ncbi:class 1 fructose-bisphosphatase [Thioclava sp. 'Guangxiensis']|uniref:class 1 fructose-bisphosphatase n=1 Tax=Thioclava sp. 'Guangxiensis' TaxID=3149044 RepID=UPI0038782DD8